MPVKHQAQTSSSHLALSRGLNYHSLTSVCSLFKIILFIYLFLAVLVPRCCADSARVAASGGYSLAEMLASHCGGFFFGAQAPGHTGFSSCGSQAHRLNSCGTWAELLRGMWESSQIRDRTHVSCIGKQILYH